MLRNNAIWLFFFPVPFHICFFYFCFEACVNLKMIKGDNERKSNWNIDRACNIGSTRERRHGAEGAEERKIYSWQTCKNTKWGRYLTFVAGAKSHGNFTNYRNFFHHRLRILFFIFVAQTVAIAEHRRWQRQRWHKEKAHAKSSEVHIVSLRGRVSERACRTNP